MKHTPKKQTGPNLPKRSEWEEMGFKVPEDLCADEPAKKLGIDHNTGKWTPAQYVIDAGWDVHCIEATAEHGVATCDAADLTSEQQSALFAYCQEKSAQIGKPARCPFCGSSDVHVRFYNQPSVVCEDCLCMGPASPQRLTRDNKNQC